MDATVCLRDRARWSTTCRRGTAAFMLDTGDGTHLTFAFLMRGCDDTGFVLQAILDHIADIVTGCVHSGCVRMAALPSTLYQLLGCVPGACLSA